MNPALIQSFDFPSRETGTTYRLFFPADAPLAGAGPERSLLLVTDGDDQFEPALAAYRKLDSAGRVQPVLPVGIGYGASYRSPKNKRMRDYTPTEMTGEHGTGGAETFRRALRDEVLPELEKRFALSRRDRCIAGHSLGSLFGMYAFFQAESLFYRALLSAPSIWYDDRSILQIEERFSRDRRAFPGKLFLSVGSEDSPSMSSDLELLEKALADRPYEGLEVTSRRFAGKDHYNVLPDAFETGLAVLFGK